MKMGSIDWKGVEKERPELTGALIEGAYVENRERRIRERKDMRIGSVGKGLVAGAMGVGFGFFAKFAYDTPYQAAETMGLAAFSICGVIGAVSCARDFIRYSAEIRRLERGEDYDAKRVQ